MYKIFIPFLMILFMITGCSQKLNEYAKPTDLLHEQALTATQKVVIKDGKETKAYITVTHVDEIQQDKIVVDKQTNTFLIGIYIPSEDKKQDFFDLSYVKVNDVIAGCITPLKSDDPILDIISFKNPWSIYLLVEAPIDTTKKGVTLEIFLEDIGVSKLSFYDGYGNLPMGTSVSFKTAISSN